MRPKRKDGNSEKFESMLFSVCRNAESGLAEMRVFLQEIQRTGIRAKTDPRLAKVIRKMESFRPRPSASIESLALDFDQFKQVLQGNLPLLKKIFRNELVIPEFQALCRNVTELYKKFKDNCDGARPNIPHLSRVSKEKWAISICTVDGQRFSIGDVNDKFTVQSTSKPVTYSLTLQELGTDIVHKHQGREPSGRMFNEIVLDHNNQPHNPMVNSGAIMSASILLHLVQPKMKMAQKYDYVFDFFKRMAGGEYLGFNNSIFLSERESGDRNCALAYFMRENMCFPTGDINITNVLDFYFQLCSLEMTSESESVLASTLANGGVCPTTDEEIVQPNYVKNVLSLMLSCGLYNYSGDFAFKVGLPAKSGVSGSLLLVIPNVMGICLWSPPLDEMGNSVRGVHFCEEFARMYNFHKVTGELADGSTCLIDPMKNKYETASQLIIHLLMAASAGDETALKCAFQQGVDMNLGDYDGRTALHLAAAEGHNRCVEYLLEECNVTHDCKDRWGQTPLTESILFKHTKVASTLRRHERMLQRKAEKTQTGRSTSNSVCGDTLWRQLVERNLLKPEKEKPVYKFDKNNLTPGNDDAEEEKAAGELTLGDLELTLKVKVADADGDDDSGVANGVSSGWGGGGGGGGDSEMPAAKKNSVDVVSSIGTGTGIGIGEQMGLVGSEAETTAAKYIQNRFRSRRLSKVRENGFNNATNAAEPVLAPSTPGISPQECITEQSNE